MATILLSAVGAGIGAGFGGSVLGLSGAVIGRAVGATLGRVIDQRLMGAGSEVVETGKVERFRLTGASEGTPVARMFGRMRLGGQVIWATRFVESVNTTVTGGSKGAARQPTVTTTSYAYSVSLAIALCEGEITRVGRVWADGEEIARGDLGLRVYSGAEDQLPDPKIEAVEGAGNAPAYRGIAYVVIEDLPLSRFGNRVPQFTFEVLRPALPGQTDGVADLVRGVRAVALMPGTGEYALATTPVHYAQGLGVNVSANVNSPSGKTDLATSIEILGEELPNCGSVSLLVSWFGDDLRCGQCKVKPKVEQAALDGVGMPWSVSGIGRSAADVIVQAAGRPIYGATPADGAVIEAIRAIHASGKAVMFYPFLLMEQLAGNGKQDPYTGAANQPVLPWRGRITSSVAPGLVGTVDRTAAAASQVAVFFGTVQPSHFTIGGGQVTYSGPPEYSMRRFILHYAALAAAAGGVEAFCIGSEMRGLSQIRGAGDSFPAVVQMKALAADVRTMLGAGTKIGYATDWSEYSGYQSPEGNRYFHLDPLWSDSNINFVGIDNYMPLADWRDGFDHADAGYGSIYNIDYLQANIAGGEGFDWYYASPEEADAQIRTPITDGAFGEPWIYRYKDLNSWWSLPHFERIGGVRQLSSTSWIPTSKPFWFTEFGCAAIDKGANEPNKFLDPKSSESGLPNYSNGRRDDLMQMQYLRAVMDYWQDPGNNPISQLYSGPMVDVSRAHVWAWDARPYPQFPNNLNLWSDGGNYAKGHWITGRTASQPLANVVAELCERSGLTAYSTDKLYGLVRGYSVASIETARSSLQPLMLAYGFDAIERGGVLDFRMRDARPDETLQPETLVEGGGSDGRIETTRSPAAEVAGRVRLNFVAADGDYEARSAEAIFPDEVTVSVAQTDISLVLTEAEGRGLAERWLAEARVARDRARFALPPSKAYLGAGDIIEIDDGAGSLLYRIDRVEQAGVNGVEAIRVESGLYQPSDIAEERVFPRPFVAPVPTYPLFLDLPLLTGTEVEHEPHIAVTATPWPGTVAVYSSASDNGYVLNQLLPASATIGVTQSILPKAEPGVWDRGSPLRVKAFGGTLSSVTEDDILNGANLMAIGDGSKDNWELFQFKDAVLVSQGVYDLSFRLRGQLGSDALVPASWPPGSQVVLINAALQQVELPISARGLARHFRIGSALRSVDDPSYVHLIEAFDGIGLRPYSPAHLNGTRLGNGDLGLNWIRRTRIDGDSWASVEVPLGETSEAYLVQVFQGSTKVREITATLPNWTYSQAQQLADGVSLPFTIRVAQISDRFGAGLFKGIAINV